MSEIGLPDGNPALNVKIPLTTLVETLNIFETVVLLLSKSHFLKFALSLMVISFCMGLYLFIKSIKVYQKHLLYGGIEREHYTQLEAKRRYNKAE